VKSTMYGKMPPGQATVALIQTGAEAISAEGRASRPVQAMNQAIAMNWQTAAAQT
jgi:hypothetical protein